MIDKLTKIFCISRDICWDMDSISLLASLICVSLILGCSGKQWIFPNCGYTCELLNYARNCNGLFVSSPAPLSLRLSPAVTVTLGFRQRLRLKLNNKKKKFHLFLSQNSKVKPYSVVLYIPLFLSLTHAMNFCFYPLIPIACSTNAPWWSCLLWLMIFVNDAGIIQQRVDA